MTDSSEDNYYMPYYCGPVTDGRGNPTVGFTRYQLSLFNRTGKERGSDAKYTSQQITLAVKLANKAETDAQLAIGQSSSAQAAAAVALSEAIQADSDAKEAQKTADAAGQDAKSALLAAEDLLVLTLLTYGSLTAKTAQSLDDAALNAAQSQILWPFLRSQSNQV